MTEKLKGYLHDIATALAAGVLLAVVAAGCAFLLGWLLNGFSTASALLCVRAVLFVVGAVLLFLAAGFLIWPKGDAKLRASEKWKRFFRRFSMAGLLLWSAAAILLLACLLDFAMFGN